MVRDSPFDCPFGISVPLKAGVEAISNNLVLAQQR